MRLIWIHKKLRNEYVMSIEMISTVIDCLNSCMKTSTCKSLSFNKSEGKCYKSSVRITPNNINMLCHDDAIEHAILMEESIVTSLC